MTFPVPGPTTAEWVRLFEAVHVGLTERDQARTELEEQHKQSAKLALDLRSAEDRLKEAAARLAEHEQLRAGQAADIAFLQRTADQPAAPSERPHTGPPGRCQCGPTHGHGQAVALNAGRDRIEAKA